jgi:hypothetical protein
VGLILAGRRNDIGPIAGDYRHGSAPTESRRRATIGTMHLCVCNHRYRSSWIERIYKYSHEFPIAILVKKYLDRKKRSLEKSYIEPRIYEYLSAYFNELIRYLWKNKKTNGKTSGFPTKKFKITLMEPFIRFRSRTINGDITLVVDMTNEKAIKLLNSLMKGGAIDERSIEQIKRSTGL